MFQDVIKYMYIVTTDFSSLGILLKIRKANTYLVICHRLQEKMRSAQKLHLCKTPYK